MRILARAGRARQRDAGCAARLARMIGFLKPAPFAAPLPAGEVDPLYRRLRRRVFAGIFFGYAGYYLVRNNLALAIPDLLREHPAFTKAELGSARYAGRSAFAAGALRTAAGSARLPRP